MSQQNHVSGVDDDSSDTVKITTPSAIQNTTTEEISTPKSGFWDVDPTQSQSEIVCLMRSKDTNAQTANNALKKTKIKSLDWTKIQFTVSGVTSNSETPMESPTESHCSFAYIYDEYLKYDRNQLSRFYVLLVNLIMPSISIFVVSLGCKYFEEPFVFPSLGPTLFLHFAIPDHPPSQPRNTIFGHLIGIIVGYVALVITGLQDHKSVFVEGITLERIGCASLSTGVTCYLMILLLLNHPPAAATCLIVALGTLTTFKQFGIMMCSVTVITIMSWILNTIVRNDAVYPLWCNNYPTIWNHFRKLFQGRYIYNRRNRTCACCKYDRKDMKFVHVVLINLLCPAAGLCIIGVIGWYANIPMLFPSLGPTAFVQFAIFQEAPASPKNTLFGHLMGIIFGYLGLLIFCLTDNPSVAIEGVSMNRIGCIVFALGFTCLCMVLFRLGHPPGAATALIVAFGLLKQYWELMTLMASVVILTIFAFVINRILRNDAVYPIWRKMPTIESDKLSFAKRSLTRSNISRGVLEEEMGYHHFPTL